MEENLKKILEEWGIQDPKELAKRMIKYEKKRANEKHIRRKDTSLYPSPPVLSVLLLPLSPLLLSLSKTVLTSGQCWEMSLPISATKFLL